MASVSLCMIVRDEEEVLERCLDSVAELVDEIVIVDTGSKDGTVDIAKKYTENIFSFAWRDDFAAARNYALEQADMEFCMWLDADDVFLQEYREEFRKLKENLNDKTDLVMMPYETDFDQAGRPVFVYERERIFRNCPAYRFLGRVHEAVPLTGNIVHAGIPIRHRKQRRADSARNLRIYRKMEEENERFDSRSLYYYGRELAAQGELEKAEKVLEEFLARPDGWRENQIDAARQIGYCRYGLGDREKALQSFFRSFCYDAPRGEVCCDIGRHFLDRKEYSTAAYWFRQALSAEKKTETGAFVQEECYGYLPAILLSVCYDRMGKYRKAWEMNELAGRYCPESEYYLSNREYFRKVHGWETGKA